MHDWAFLLSIHNTISHKHAQVCTYLSEILRKASHSAEREKCMQELLFSAFKKIKNKLHFIAYSYFEASLIFFFFLILVVAASV